MTVAFEDVTFSYPGSESTVLRHVELEVEEGCFALVCGATGSGKSTLLRAVNGLVPHFSGGRFSGHVKVEGRDTLTHAPRELSDVVAFVPQDPNASFVVDRVEDEIAYAMENLGFDRPRMARRVEEMLDLLALAPLRGRSVRSLSGGERQRVAIAAALAPGARIVVLDEPTSQLDPQGAEDVLSALQRLVHDLGMTVLLAEHRFERVAGFADVAIGCEGGGKVFTGAPGEVFDRLRIGPPVARLGRMLGWRSTPLTVRDARRTAAGLELPAPAEEGPSGGKEILTTRGVYAGYDETMVLHDVDVALREGEIVALVGRNGAGKSTLLRTLAGLLAPAKGTVSFRGASPRPGDDVALCPQRAEDVLFSETVAGEIDATRGGRLDVLARLGLAALADRHPRDLSAGQRVLLATAAVAVTDASVLLLDEPTRGLDHESKDALGSFLREEAGRGRTIVVATHDVELAAEICPRVVMLAEGRVVADGTASDILGDSPVFAPQTARVFGPQWLTPAQVAGALAR